MAAITSKGSPGFFAIVVFIFVTAEMVSAWKNTCVPGDIYMDSYTAVSEPECGTCTAWCKSQCSSLELSMVKHTDKCSIINSTLRCKCCCETPPPPPPSPSASDFVGPQPYNIEICVGNQRSQKFRHPDGKDCIHKPLCEKSCNEKGLSKARSECVGAGGLSRLTWYEQCCCEKLALSSS